MSWKKFLEILLQIYKETTQIQIDSTYIKAHQHSAGAKKKGGNGEGIGKSRGRLTSKIHAITNSNGNAMNFIFIITGGNMNDCTRAENMLTSFIHKGVSVLADRAYDTDKIIEYIKSKSAIAVISTPNNRNIKREYDKKIYKNRNQIERFFNRLKHFRRIATRYDKLASSFLSLVQLATALILIPKFPSIVYSIPPRR